MNKSDLDLLQRVLDGDATPKERAQLEVRMTADPGLRASFDSMTSLFRALDVDALEPAPATLRDDVLNALPAAPRYAAQSASRTQWSWPRLVLPVASAAAALALVVVAIRMAPSPLALNGRSAGSMSGMMPGPVQFELPVEGAGFRVAASRDAKGVAQLEMTTDAPVRVSLSSVRGSVEFEGAATPAESGSSLPPSKERLDWYLKPGVTLRVRCSPGRSPGLINVRVATPSHAASEIGIRLESLPIVHLP